MVLDAATLQGGRLSGPGPAAGVPLVLAVAWAGLIVAGSQRWRPAPLRVRRMVAAGTFHRRGAAGGSPLGAAATAASWRAVDRLGSAVLVRIRGEAATDAGTARRVGAGLLAVGAGLAVHPVVALVAGAVAWVLPVMGSRHRARRRLDAVRAELPDVVDLFALAVGAGYTVRLAVAGVGPRAPGVVGAELRRAEHEAALGRRLADALADIPARAGEPVRPLVAALVASERYGAPLGPGLERLADEVRRDRRRRAEEAARRIPVKLLFPLVTCTLPAFALLTVAPLVAGAIRTLSLT